MWIVRRFLLSLISAIAWGFVLDLAAYIAGKAYRRRSRGAVEMLDASL